MVSPVHPSWVSSRNRKVGYIRIRMVDDSSLLEVSGVGSNQALTRFNLLFTNLVDQLLDFVFDVELVHRTQHVISYGEEILWIELP